MPAGSQYQRKNGHFFTRGKPLHRSVNYSFPSIILPVWKKCTGEQQGTLALRKRNGQMNMEASPEVDTARTSGSGEKLDRQLNPDPNFGQVSSQKSKGQKSSAY